MNDVVAAAMFDLSPEATVPKSLAGIVYKIVFDGWDKVYVGFTMTHGIRSNRWIRTGLRTRLRQHLNKAQEGSKRPLYEAMREHGARATKIVQLLRCPLIEVLAKEIEQTIVHNALWPNGLNLQLGALRGRIGRSEAQHKRVFVEAFEDIEAPDPVEMRADEVSIGSGRRPHEPTGERERKRKRIAGPALTEPITVATIYERGGAVTNRFDVYLQTATSGGRYYKSFSKNGGREAALQKAYAYARAMAPKVNMPSKRSYQLRHGRTPEARSALLNTLALRWVTGVRLQRLPRAIRVHFDTTPPTEETTRFLDSDYLGDPNRTLAAVLSWLNASFNPFPSYVEIGEGLPPIN